MIKPSFILLLIAISAHLPACAQPLTPELIAIEHVNVISMDNDTIDREQTVLIRGRRIETVGNAADTDIPAGATRVNGRGKYLLPGLAEMHGHIPGAKSAEKDVERFMWLNVLNGITTVRGMLGDDIQLQWRREIARGERLGPQLFLAGDSINGKSVTSKDDAFRRVTEQRAAGYDLLKIHPGLSWENFQQVAKSAAAENMPFAGHIPTDVGLERALNAGISSVEHLDGYIDGLRRPGFDNPQDFWGITVVDDVDESRIALIVQQTLAAGAWVTPTNTLYETFLGLESVDNMLDREDLRYWPQKQVDVWVEQVSTFRKESGEMLAQRQRVLELRARLIRELQATETGILLGADAPQIFNVPGFATIREVENLVANGLSEYQALKAGTVNPARYFGLENSFGQVKEGMRADLILVDDNPLEDISKLRQPYAVVLAGRWFSREMIEEKLASLKVSGR